MNELRTRARSLYPRLDASQNKYAKQAKQKLDRALTDSTGVIDASDPKALLLSQACDYAEMILG